MAAGKRFPEESKEQYHRRLQDEDWMIKAHLKGRVRTAKKKRPLLKRLFGR